MSHFAIAVITKTGNQEEIERLLAPYSETDEKYYKLTEIKVSDQDVSKFVKSLTAQEARLLLYGPTEDLMRKFAAYNNLFYKDFKLYERYNPDAIYDYYTIGGRDCLWFEDVDEPYKVKDIDISYKELNEAQLAYVKEQYEDMLQEKGWYKSSYVKERWPSVDDYIEEETRPDVPYYFITPDGKLHSPGTIGWFATSTESFDSQKAHDEDWIETVKEYGDYYISICDAHI